jgi:Mg2+-importing ATPase
LTGENEPQRKSSGCQAEKPNQSILELENILFMGTNVVSGSGLGVVLRTGDGKFPSCACSYAVLIFLSDAFIATIMKQIMKNRPQNAFQRGIEHLSWVMIVVIIVVCPIVSSLPQIGPTDVVKFCRFGL